MYYLIFGIVILGIITAIIGYFGNRRRERMLKNGTLRIENESAPAVDPDCCGEHQLCERDSLLAAVSKEIEYYNDEELDEYCGAASDTYSEKAVEEFREVLYTLQEIEVAGWLRSLQLRRIDLPDQIKDEALLIVEERRKVSTSQNKH